MAEPTDLTTEVLERAASLGFELVGICDPAPPAGISHYLDWLAGGLQAEMSYLTNSVELRSNPETLLPGVKSIVAVGLNYNQQPKAVNEGSIKIARYALGRDYHKVLRGKLRKVQNLLIEKGHECRICVDSAPILEREYAQRAGLGWFGKNTCLINSERGSWFVIGLLLTTAPLHRSAPAVGGCGTCTKCIDSCPTGAIVVQNGKWAIDSRQCISYLTIEHRGEFSPEQAAAIGDWTFGCDICQEVCPFNTPRPSQPLRAKETAEQDFLQTRDWPSRLQLLAMAQDGWDELTRGSPVRRAGFEGLKRNARANLENGA